MQQQHFYPAILWYETPESLPYQFNINYALEFRDDQTIGDFYRTFQGWCATFGLDVNISDPEEDCFVIWELKNPPGKFVMAAVVDPTDAETLVEFFTRTYNQQMESM